jgi:hypothetical protein
MALVQVVLALVVLISVSQFAVPGLVQADPSRMRQDAVPPLQTDQKTSLVMTQNHFIGPEDLLDITVSENADLRK